MIPQREVATNNGQTYFVTSNTAERRCLFRSEKWADLFVETLYGYRPERLAIHGFVVMEDHFHLLMTPTQSLERAVQCIKGGFSFRAKKYLGWNGEIWVTGFSDHRIRDEEDYVVHQRYIAKNALECRGIGRAKDHPYCSAGGRFELDAFPQGLKPGSVVVPDGATKVAPFQSKSVRDRDTFPRGLKPDFVGEPDGAAKAAPFQNKSVVAKAAPFQSGSVEANAEPFQDKSEINGSRTE